MIKSLVFLIFLSLSLFIWSCAPTIVNSRPSIPNDPNPADGATDVPINVTLSWSCSDPDGDTLTYDIYFGTSTTPLLVKSDHTSTTYNPRTLDFGTTYYWKIVAKDGKGGVTEGPVWSFTTESISGSLYIESAWLLTDNTPDNTGPIYSSPGVSPNGWVYVGGQTNLYRLKTMSGFFCLTPSSSPILSSPAFDVDSKLLYVGTNNGDLIIWDTENINVHAQKRVSSCAIYTAPLIIGNNVYIVDACGILRCLDLNGNNIWSKVITDYDVRSSPVTDGQYIYIADTGGNVYSVTFSGNEEWHYSTYDKFIGGFAIDKDGNLYIAGEKLWSFTKEGSLRWSVNLDGQVHANPVVSRNGVVYVGTSRGVLYAIDSSDGNTLWTNYLGEGIFSSCVIGDNEVIHVVIGRCLYAIKPCDGTPIDFVELESYVESNPVLYDSYICVGAASGRFYFIKSLSNTISDPTVSWPMFQRDIYHTGTR